MRTTPFLFILCLALGLFISSPALAQEEQSPTTIYAQLWNGTDYATIASVVDTTPDNFDDGPVLAFTAVANGVYRIYADNVDTSKRNIPAVRVDGTEACTVLITRDKPPNTTSSDPLTTAGCYNLGTFVGNQGTTNNQAAVSLKAKVEHDIVSSIDVARLIRLDARAIESTGEIAHNFGFRISPPPHLGPIHLTQNLGGRIASFCGMIDEITVDGNVLTTGDILAGTDHNLGTFYPNAGDIGTVTIGLNQNASIISAPEGKISIVTVMGRRVASK